MRRSAKANLYLVDAGTEVGLEDVLDPVYLDLVETSHEGHLHCASRQLGLQPLHLHKRTRDDLLLGRPGH